jgi:hypothetical protein
MRHAAGDAAMELRGDEAGLALEVGGVIGPRREELLHALWVDSERIDENDRVPCVVVSSKTTSATCVRVL